METLKLFLASSFAVGATLRVCMGVAGEAILASGPTLSAFLAGPGGMAAEAFLSLVAGGALAAHVASTRKRKASRG